jgi:hypothetical protein
MGGSTHVGRLVCTRDWERETAGGEVIDPGQVLATHPGTSISGRLSRGSGRATLSGAIHASAPTRRAPDRVVYDRVPLWAKLLRMPRPQLYAGILFFASLGAYSVNQDPFDLALLLAFGALGFAIRRFGIPVLPLILGVILGPLMEVKLREALDLSGGDLSGLFNEGLAIFIYVLIVLAIALPVVLSRLRGPHDEFAHDTQQEVDR